MELNQEKLEKLVGHMLNELGAAISSTLIVSGDRLGLYRTLAESGSLSAADLSKKTGTDLRYLQEWLYNQVASGYVSMNPEGDRFYLTPEQAAVFADEESPAYLVGGFYSVVAVANDEPLLTEAMRSGKGIGWGEHHQCLFCGTAKFFRPAYQTHLVNDWLPALNGRTAALENGGSVADVGCGFGLSTILMAKAFPRATFTGFDIHAGSIEEATRLAKKEGVTNVSFKVASAQDFPGRGYDLVTCFDCLHDMGDPAGAARHILSTLEPDGSWLIVEPYAADDPRENMHPLGRAYYGFSTAICVPASKSQEVGLGLGAQAGAKKLEAVVREGGFSRFRKATETPFNLVLEAQP